MPDVLVKDLPAEVHRRLKEEAKRHHRSMNQEIRQILETKFMVSSGLPAFRPFVATRPLTQAFIRKAIQEGRK